MRPAFKGPRPRAAGLVVGILLPLLACRAALADFREEYLTDPQDGRLDASRYLSEVPMGFLPVPKIITEPAVGYGLGLGAVFFHESAEQRRQRTSEGVLLPENISILGAGATENGTWGAGVGHLGFWRKDTVRYRGFLAYAAPNLDFYSVPGLGDLDRAIELNLKGPLIFQQLLFRLPGTKVLAGLQQLYRTVDTSLAGSTRLANLPPEVAEFLDNQLSASTTTSGLGPVLQYDSRDNPLNPQSGYFYSANYLWFDDALGSDVSYQSFDLTSLNYWMLTAHLNLALRLELDGVDAGSSVRLPVYVPPYINLRGVPASRYQGARVVVGEVELDYKLDPRWKVGVFAGAGRAADKAGDLGNAQRVNTYGAGFRYLIARRYGLVVGLDVARGPEETAFYIQAGSTW